MKKVQNVWCYRNKELSLWLEINSLLYKLDKEI